MNDTGGFDILKAEPLLRRPAHIPEQPRFPVVDTHGHLYREESPEELIQIMDAAGVRTFVNLTGNVELRTVGVELRTVGVELRLFRRDISYFMENYVETYPGRFVAFTMAEFAQFDDPLLFGTDDFAERCVVSLRADVGSGACGLKILKELGLYFRDRDGSMVRIDDPRLAPIWEEARRLDVPVLIHTSDPVAFFRPVDFLNERYTDLKECPGWSFHRSFFSKDELLAQRNRMIAAHPRTRFILPHVGNYAEDLDEVARTLENLPNTVIDLSARIDELGRQPYSARDFILRYQDRILFGTDMPASVDTYRCHYRFYETRDEYFEYPDYAGRWGNFRWRIYGLYLPDEVLMKIYSANAERIIPGLRGAP